MLARGQLSVLLLLAAVACTAARPDTLTHKRSYEAHRKGGPQASIVNTVQVVPDPQVSSVLIFPTDPPISDPKSDATNSVPVAASSDPEPIPQRFRDATTPVNKKYPHAVLFGGTCGGSIIHPKWVLTAGHCTLFTNGRYVLGGTNNSDDSSGIVKKVKKLHVHPLFSVGPYWLNAHKFDIKQVAARWDFMLAELEEPFDLDGTTIAAAPLPSQASLLPGTYVGYAGYGTDHHGGYMRSLMHEMNLKTQTNKTCGKALEQFNGEDMFCAKGYEPNFDSACNGDSGSGLVTGDGTLVGVASWVQNDAIECAKSNLVVFSKVSSVLNWITKTLQS